jgi:hypothetical protein
MKRFLRLFREYQELEKGLEREAGLAASLGRYIEALEGRDKERAAQIEELAAKLRDALGAVRDMRVRLAGLCPGRKEGS